MTDLALDDIEAVPDWQAAWRRAGHRLEAYARLRRIRRQPAVAQLRRFDRVGPSHLDRWADLYVRHGI